MRTISSKSAPNRYPKKCQQNWKLQTGPTKILQGFFEKVGIWISDCYRIGSSWKKHQKLTSKQLMNLEDFRISKMA